MKPTAHSRNVVTLPDATHDVAGDVPLVVPVLAATGGAGATTVSCGISVEVAAQHGRSLLIDLDLERGDTHSLWDVPSDRTIHDLHDVRENIRPEHVELVGYSHASGVVAVRSPGVFGAGDGWTADHLAALIAAARREAVCVIDCGHAPFDHIREACRLSGQLVVVAPVTARAARRVRVVVEAIGDVGVTLVVNRGAGPSDVSTRTFARIAGGDIDVSIPRSVSGARRIRGGMRTDNRRLRAALHAIVGRVVDGN